MSTKLHTPVLIVGGGPVGLSLALDLTWRGIECMLVEKTDGSVNHPKTGHIAIRTMEFCRRWGIAERVRNCGFPDDYRLNVVFCTSLCGHQLARRDYPTPAEDKAPPQSPEKKQRAPQMYFDPILAAAMPSLGRAARCRGIARRVPVRPADPRPVTVRRATRRLTGGLAVASFGSGLSPAFRWVCFMAVSGAFPRAGHRLRLKA